MLTHAFTGNVDLSDLLSSMDDQIAKAKEQALSRKDILDKVEKWRYAIEEEKWLEEYERVKYLLSFFPFLFLINNCNSLKSAKAQSKYIGSIQERSLASSKEEILKNMKIQKTTI